jgi:hypothetical protein
MYRRIMNPKVKIEAWKKPGSTSNFRKLIGAPEK